MSYGHGLKMYWEKEKKEAKEAGSDLTYGADYDLTHEADYDLTRLGYFGVQKRRNKKEIGHSTAASKNGFRVQIGCGIS